LLQGSDSPDILVFGFQELVDLEDKKTTASKSGRNFVLQWLISSQKVFSSPRRRIPPNKSTWAISIGLGGTS